MILCPSSSQAGEYFYHIFICISTVITSHPEPFVDLSYLPYSANLHSQELGIRFSINACLTL